MYSGGSKGTFNKRHETVTCADCDYVYEVTFRRREEGFETWDSCPNCMSHNIKED
jgi:Zn finger protein HypA/HybF involved in hydrogenase expression